jgi:hypothetical protein
VEFATLLRCEPNDAVHLDEGGRLVRWTNVVVPHPKVFQSEV